MAHASTEETNIENAPNTALMARRTPIDMSLPGDESISHPEVFIKQSKWRRVRIAATASVAVSLVLAITLGGLFLSQDYLKLHKVFRGDAPTADALKPTAAASLLKGQSSGRVNVLVLGRDGSDHANPDVTNTVMVASIDTINHTTTLMSVPSNLWVNVPNTGLMKMGAVWQSGEFNFLNSKTTGSTDPKAIAAGFKTADQTVSQVLGVNINYNVVVNIQALQQMVDTVGGITVNVPTELVDPTMAWQNGNNPVLAQAGTQTMNGKQAYLYVSSKETTSDFARDQRQSQVLSALVDKMMTASTYSSPSEINSLLDTFGNNVSTDMSLSDAGKLYKVVQNVSTNVSYLDMTDAPNQLIVTGNANGQAVDIPQAGLFNYSAIKQYVASQLVNPFLIKENAKVLVLNGTDVSGLATTMGSTLRADNYNVLGAANAPSNVAKTTLIDLNKNDKYTNASLEQKLHLKSVNKLPNKSIPTDGADFVIIIGDNEANTSQN